MAPLGLRRTQSSEGPQLSRLTSNEPNTLRRLHSAYFVDDASTYHNRHTHFESEAERRLSEASTEHGESEEAIGRREIEATTSPLGGLARTSAVVDEDIDLEKQETAEDEEGKAANMKGAPRRDLDRPMTIQEEKELEMRRTRTMKEKDPYLVTWEGIDDPQNPKNWSYKKKWAATVVVSSFTFISPVSSSMVAPAIATISKELGIKSTVEAQLTMSIFVLAYAIGPLIMGPLSEIYGRVPIIQLSNLFFLLFNIACGVSRSKGEMLAFRFLAGLGGSAPLALGGGVLSDCWRAEERGKAISIYSLAPLLGPALGPIAGGFLTQHTSWRWVFHVTSIVDALIQISGFFFLKETYAPKLLHRKAEQLRKDTGNESWHTEYEHPEKTLFNLLRTSLVRPFRLLGTQIIIQVLAVYMAFLYGLMYLVLSTFPLVWQGQYHESISIGGLNYLSLGLGLFIGAQSCARINDNIYRRLKKRNNNTGRPEFRVPLMIPGSILVPVGLFWYGWSVQAHTHWIVPNIGVVFLGAGTIMGFQCIQTYVVDAYTRFAASAIGAVTVLRSLAGFGFPLFAPYMYKKLEYGWGNSVLGFLAIALGIPGPFFLWKYGERLRGMSKFAAGA